MNLEGEGWSVRLWHAINGPGNDHRWYRIKRVPAHNVRRDQSRSSCA